VRKRSGELVKSAIRDASSFSSLHHPLAAAPKAVRFSNLEQVHYFFETDTPTRLQLKSSAKWKIVNSNVPGFSQSKSIRVEELHLSEDYQGVVGTVAVENVAFQKRVAARYTFDYWYTLSEVLAEYTQPRIEASTDQYDRFQFIIRLPCQSTVEQTTLLFCARYEVGGQEYWDNNSDKNFRVSFERDYSVAVRKGYLSGRHLDTKGKRVNGEQGRSNEPSSQRYISEFRGLTPDSITWLLWNRSREDLNSPSYKHFIQEYCFALV